jgi:capsular exopolysaccharide synthesis family protein
MPNFLPPPEGDRNSALPAVPVTYTIPPGYGPTWDAAPEEAEPQSVPLAQHFRTVLRHKWKIAALVAVCTVSTFIVSKRITPIYESTATIDVDLRMPTGIIGQDANQSAFADADRFLATQINTIQSDSVLRSVAEDFKLRAPRKAPAGGNGPAADVFEDAPVGLADLKVVRPPNTFLLKISYRSLDPRVAANVANAVANSYIEHTYDVRYRSTVGLASFMEKQIEELRTKTERSSGALADFERQVGVINPEEKTGILSARLVQLNTDYLAAQTERLKKESAFKSVSGGSLEAAEISSQGESLKALNEQVEQAKAKFAQVQAQYGKNHPEYPKAAAQLAQVQGQFERARESVARRVETEYKEAVGHEATLKTAVDEAKAEYDAVNSRSFQYLNLKREADADRKLYEELLEKIKEAGINANFQNSAIRLSDPARPVPTPVFPNVRQNVALALLFSLMLGVGAAVALEAMDSTVRNPEQVERALNTEVIGTLPLVKTWRQRAGLRLASPAPADTPEASTAPLAVAGSRGYTESGFGEAIHTLRNSILLGSFDGPIRTILITSATPQEGKTTVAAQLAMAHAEHNKRTLLIDADLRRPGIANSFSLHADVGLAAVLSDGLVWRDKLVKHETLPYLDILTAGKASRRVVSLIGRGLPRILEEAEKDYDMVVIDSPPLLGFPEPLEMAALVDGVVVVALAGKTNRKAVASVLSTLRRVRAHTLGIVLNEVSQGQGEGYYYYGSKYYRYYRPEAKG